MFVREVQITSLLVLLLFMSCHKCLEEELFLGDNNDAKNHFSIRLVSYNIHGGKGPSGEGDFSTNLKGFKALLQGEQILCLQEVEPDKVVPLQEIFDDYPYFYYSTQQTTKGISKKCSGNLILSQLPILSAQAQKIQTDPEGDQWERKAQVLKFYIGGLSDTLVVYHYHNTFNWHRNNSEYERRGMERYREWIEEQQISSSNLQVGIGDFNITERQALEIMDTTYFYQNQSQWVDHIFSSAPFNAQGFYPTYSMKYSDHNAVWALLSNQ